MYEQHHGSKIDAIRYAQRLADVVGLELMVISRPCKAEGRFRYYVEQRCNPLEQTVDKVIYKTRGPGLFPAIVSSDAAQAVKQVSRHFRQKLKRSDDDELEPRI